jgi:hypothetical protein
LDFTPIPLHTPKASYTIYNIVLPVYSFAQNPSKEHPWELGEHYLDLRNMLKFMQKQKTNNDSMFWNFNIHIIESIIGNLVM